jgi:hypothetical protein
VVIFINGYWWLFYWWLLVVMYYKLLLIILCYITTIGDYMTWIEVIFII